MSMAVKLVVSALVLLFTRVFCESLDEGDICAVQSSWSLGICRVVRDCPPVIEDLRKRIFTHTRCGFVGKDEVVCCPYTPKPLTPETTTVLKQSTPVAVDEIKTEATPNAAEDAGVCTKVSNFDSIINGFNSVKLPEVCGADGSVEAVCCPVLTFKEDILPELQVKSILRKSQEKCTEYAKLVFNNFVVLTPDNVEGTSVVGDTCSLYAEEYASYDVYNNNNNVRIQVVGGEEATRGEFPHMVALGFDLSDGLIEWTCGGTLISDNFVLTAAHCLKHQLYGEVKYVKIGTINLSPSAAFDTSLTLSIIERIPFPSYTDSENYDDIALLKLNATVPLSSQMRPACLPTEQDVSEEDLIATGWGQTAFSGMSSPKLLKVTLERFSFAECNMTYGGEDGVPHGIDDAKQLCAGHRTEVKDTCQGDSGGPLQVFHSNEYCSYTVIGVTSFGKFCAQIGVPGAYTRVYNYIDWIESIVW